MAPDRSDDPTPSGGEPGPGAEPAAPDTILRFQRTERLLHWALAGPFVLLYVSALGLALSYGEAPPRTWHQVFATAHRVLGALLIVLPPLALLAGGSVREHLDNMREGWRWTRDDFRWLVLFPRSTVDPRVTLPEQGKFNAAEKLNFMMVSATYPFYIVTGLLVWSPGVAVVEYVAHLAVALLGLPLVLGHIFMATVNPSTRVGLSGMVTGWVDRSWARHHYERWYRDTIETRERQDAARKLVDSLARPSRVACGSCRTVHDFGSWRDLIARAFQVEPLFCPACAAELPITEPDGPPRAANAILEHLERGDAERPFVASARTADGGSTPA